MEPQSDHPLLCQPIAALPLSVLFKVAAIKNQLATLGAVSDLHVKELLALPGFDHQLWNEYAAFLEANGLGHLLNKKSPPRE